jgi:hypothetical protein
MEIKSVIENQINFLTEVQKTCAPDRVIALSVQILDLVQFYQQEQAIERKAASQKDPAGDSDKPIKIDANDLLCRLTESTERQIEERQLK